MKEMYLHQHWGICLFCSLKIHGNLLPQVTILQEIILIASVPVFFFLIFKELFKLLKYEKKGKSRNKKRKQHEQQTILHFAINKYKESNPEFLISEFFKSLK